MGKMVEASSEALEQLRSEIAIQAGKAARLSFEGFG